MQMLQPVWRHEIEKRHRGKIALKMPTSLGTRLDRNRAGQAADQRSTNDTGGRGMGGGGGKVMGGKERRKAEEPTPRRKGSHRGGKEVGV